MQLNQEQEKAAFSENSINLVLAGAGTGKTKVIITRIEHIISQGIAPEKIIATTFTNKAGKEIKARLFQTINEKAYMILCGTFHRISAQILRSHGHLISLKDDFKILTEDEQKRIVKRILKQLSKEEEKVKSILEKISAFKENNQDFENKLFKQVFEIYQEQLNEHNMLDYSDLIKKAILLFKTQPELTQNIAHHVLVDEYQDINQLQYEWIKLVSKEKNLFCVGDEDQAIYAFRGASIKYIQKFQEDFPKAQIIKLEKNYRSCKEILKGAVNLISKNDKKFKKNLIAANEELKGFIKISKLLNEYDEASFCAKLIAEWKEKHPEYTIGVLVRTNMQINYIEHALVEAKIPYSILSGKKFYAKSEIQDIVSYLRSIVFPNDFLAFARILNSPKRNMGEVRLNLLLDAMKSLNCNFESAIATLMDQLPKNAAEKCKILMIQIKKWRSIYQTTKCEEIVQMILDDVNYIELTQLKEKQINNINILKEHIKEHEKLEDFLKNIELASDNEEDQDIQLMTMHAAKGLEFDIVIAPGWEENVFPSLMVKNKAEIEEERRLAYVAITRAKYYLEITHAISRRINGKYKTQMPSRFIFDL